VGAGERNVGDLVAAIAAQSWDLTLTGEEVDA
jgi:hypothetical protein